MTDDTLGRLADNGNPWPPDDDLNDLQDLPAEVLSPIPHNPIVPDEKPQVRDKVMAAHLDRAMAELGSAMMRLRAARELLGE